LRGQLLRKEKDEASLYRLCETGFPECLHSPIFAGFEGFLFCSVGVKARRFPTEAVAQSSGVHPQASLWSLN